MLQRGDQVPHFTLRTLAGQRVNYSEIWQRRSLLLICLPAESTADTSRTYVSGLATRADEVTEQDADCVVTAETVRGVPCPGVVIADRWGEIYFVAGSSHAEGLPSLDELLAWLRHIRNECPECQGEAR